MSFQREFPPRSHQMLLSSLFVVACVAVSFLIGVGLGNMQAVQTRLELIRVQAMLTRQADETRKENEAYAAQANQLHVCTDDLNAYRAAVTEATSRAQAQAMVNPNAAQWVEVLRVLKAVL